MKNITIQIETLDYTKPIIFYANLYGLSVNAMRNRFIKLNIYDKFIFTSGNTAKIKSYFLKKHYDLSPKLCLQCNTIISYEKRKNKYCSSRCSSLHIQKNGGNCSWNDKDKERLREQAKKNPYFNGTIKMHPPTCYRQKKGIIKTCPNCKLNFYVPKSSITKKTCSFKCAKEMKIFGGMRHGSGRGKQGWYKGIYCNSSWELAWVIYQLDHGVAFKRNTTGFEYIFNGTKHRFYPDFIINKNEYIEIKGWNNDQVIAKISQFPSKLTILFKPEMKFYIDYVYKKYGSDFIKLYE